MAEQVIKKAKKKKMSKKKKLLIALLVVVIIAVIACITAVAVIFHYIDKVEVEDPVKAFPIVDSVVDDDITDEPDSPPEVVEEAKKRIDENLAKNATEIMSDDNVVNVLLIGTDSRSNDDRGRSDSMILVSINKNTKQVIMTSFLRDIYCYIPDIEYTRLNHAYAYGGPDLLIKTLETNFKVRVDRYVRVNFFSFMEVIDTIGGVDIDITDEEVPYMNDPSITHGGSYKLNGEQALTYSRIRYLGTDFARTQRQRTVLEDIIRKMKNLSMSELSDLLDVLLPKLATNMTESEMFSFVVDSPVYLKYKVVQNRIPADGTWSFITVRSMSVIDVNFDKNIDELRSVIYGQ